MIAATRYVLTCAVVAALPSAGLGQSPPSPLLPDTVPLDSAVRHGRLPNGFEYYIQRHTDPKAKAEMRLVVNAGHFHEDEDQLGLAHMVEHVAFNGTAHYPGGIREQFAQWGLVPGRDHNAATGREETTYKLRVPTDKPEVYEGGFRVMRDLAQNLTFDSAGIEAQRGVVLGEFRQKSGSVSFEMDREMEARLLDHPKYLRDPDYRRKHDENIRTFEHETLRRFFRDWYRPDLQAFMVVGDVDVDEVERRIVELFSDLEMPANPREVPPDIDAAYDVELTGKNQFLVLTGEGLPSTSVRIFHKRLGAGTTLRTVGDYRLALMYKLYNAMMRARLDPLTQRYNVPFESFYHTVGRGVLNNARIDGLRTYLAFDGSQPIGPGIRTALLELERVRRHGFLASELERARELVRTELADRRRVTSRDLVNRLVSHYTEGGAAPDPDYENALQNRILDEIDVAAINKLFLEWLGSTTDRDAVIMAPASEADRLPTEGEVERWFAEVKHGEVESYREPKPPVDRLMGAAEVARLQFDAAYTAVHNEEIGTTELRLANGITVVLKPLKPVGQFDEVVFRGSSAGGWRSYDDDKALTAMHAASIVRNAGVGTFDRFELEALLNRKDVSGGPWMREDQATVGGTAPPKELEALLQLVHLYVTAPRRDRASFEDWKSGQLAEIERRNTNRSIWLHSVIDSVRYRGRLANSPPSAEEIGRLQEDDVYRLYRERYTKPGDFVFVLAGEFDPETAVPLLVRYLGSLPSTTADRPRGEGSKVEARMGTADVTLYGGRNEDKAGVNLYFSGEYRPGPIAKVKLEVLEQALKIRMTQRLREKEGGTYSVSSNLDPGHRATDAYSFRVSFTAAPDNVDHMIGAAVEEMERLHEEGLDPALFEGAVARVKDRVKDNDDATNRPSFWTDYLLQKYHQHADVADVLKRRSPSANILTHDAINEAARRYFSTDNLMRFVVLPAKDQPSNN